VAYVRKDVPKQRLILGLQEYFRTKEFKVSHPSASTLLAFQTIPIERSITTKVALTQKNERILHAQYNSMELEDSLFFEEMFGELSEMLFEDLLFKTQQESGNKWKELPLTVTLHDDTQSPYANLVANCTHFTMNENKKEEKSALFVAFLNNDKKSDGIKQLFEKYSIDNGYKITKNSSTMEISKPNSNGEPITISMAIGFNKDKIRILHGNFPKFSANIGKKFWEGFAEVLAAQNCFHEQMADGTNIKREEAGINSPLPEEKKGHQKKEDTSPTPSKKDDSELQMVNNSPKTPSRERVEIESKKLVSPKKATKRQSNKDNEAKETKEQSNKDNEAKEPKEQSNKDNNAKEPKEVIKEPKEVIKEPKEVIKEENQDNKTPDEVAKTGETKNQEKDSD